MILEIITAFCGLCLFYFFGTIKNVINKMTIKIYNDGLIELILWNFRCIVIFFHQRFLPTRINDFNRNVNSLKICGIVPTQGDIDMEANKLVTDKYNADSIFIWGGDKSGRFVVAKITHMNKGEALIYILVADGSGSTFTIPEDIHVLEKPSRNSWRAGGLLLECLEPMRSWRLKFNGQLTSDHDSAADLVNCRINFIWRAFKKPIDIWKQTSCQLLADSMKTTDLIHFRNGLYVDGYDQWGVLHGTISFENKEHENWYLRGQRQHRFIQNSSVCKTESLSIGHYSANGEMFYLEDILRGSPINRYTLGYFLTSCGRYHTVSRASIKFKQDGNQQELLVKFSANGEEKQETFKMKNEITSKSENTLNKVFINASDRSWSIFNIEKSSDIETNKCKRNYPVIEMPKEESSVKLAVSLEDEICKLSSLAGGKGSSLACLMTLVPYSYQQHLKFEIPKGFVVTTQSWIKQMEINPTIREEIILLQKIITDENSCSNIVKMNCERLVLLIESINVSKEIAHQIRISMEAIFPDYNSRNRFAVRSSAHGEDGSEASSAGQNKTILGCVAKDGFSSILNAVTDCWASQFTYQSVEYRRQRGQPLENDMAVVIQEMVFSRVAGVIFTNDPTTGRANEMLISANYGLGESIVSACTESDTIYLKRNIKGLQIGNVVVGDKSVKTVLKDEGTETVILDNEEAHQRCLSDEDSIRLAKVAIIIECAFGSPMDIEFAICQGMLYILQARPITTLETWTDYELIHESDEAVLTDSELFTIANTGEVFPGYIDSLTMSLVLKIIDLGIQRDRCMREWPSYEYDPFALSTLAIFSHRCMANMIELLYRGLDDKISSVNNAVDLSVFGRLVMSAEIHSWAKKRFGVMGIFPKLIRLSYGLYDFLINSIRIKRCKAIYDVYSIKQEDVSAQSFYNIICNKLPEMMKICENHTHTSSASALSQCLALIILSEGRNEITQEMVQNIAALFSCISDTESGDVPTALEELSDIICANGKSEEFTNLPNEECSHWLMQQSAPVTNKFKDFIANHGHRCIKEFYFSSLSWGMNPSSLMPSLKQMVKNGQTSTSKRTKPNLEETLNSLSGNLKPSTKRSLKFILRLCGTAVGQRETTKSMTIRSFEAFKKAFRHLAHLMVKEFRLPDRDLIYFLTHNEIEILLRSRSANLVIKAARRRKLMKSIENLEFPEISVGIPISINEHEVENDFDYGTNVYYGTPVCFGKVKGNARIIHKLEEVHLLQIGEILITKSTDVGWTPYFPLLGGVVTEIGGLISHGAVVAREYGLPCIVGLKNSTKIFNSGELVLLDGKEGSIRRIRDEVPII